MKRYVFSIGMVVLMLSGFGMFLFFKNKEDGIIFFIAFLALVLSMAVTLNGEHQAKKIRKTKLVTGHSVRNLEIELNQELGSMKKKTIISVQVIDKMSALIVYTD